MSALMSTVGWSKTNGSADQHRDRRAVSAPTAHDRNGAAAFSSALTTCCRRAWCSALRPTCPPAAPRRRRSLMPPASAQTRQRCSTARRCAGGSDTPPTTSCSIRTGGFAWSNDQFVRTQLTGALNNATAGTDEAVNKGSHRAGRRVAALPTPSRRIGTSLPNIVIQASDRRPFRFRSRN